MCVCVQWKHRCKKTGASHVCIFAARSIGNLISMPHTQLEHIQLYVTRLSAANRSSLCSGAGQIIHTGGPDASACLLNDADM